MKKLFIAFWVLSFLALCQGQNAGSKAGTKTKPDFSGTWRLNRSKSLLRKTDLKIMPEDLTLVVRQHEAEIKITRKLTEQGQNRTQELVYFTDERGEVNPTATGKIAFLKSRTKWEKEKLVSRSFVRRTEGGTLVEISIIDEWKLSKDRKALIQTTTTRIRDDSLKDIQNSPPPGIYIVNRWETKRVFDRISE